jgi:hypothetical protein
MRIQTAVEGDTRQALAFLHQADVLELDLRPINARSINVCQLACNLLPTVIYYLYI